MEPSQNAMLQRICHSDSSSNKQQFDHLLLHHHPIASDSNNSSITTSLLPIPNQGDWQCNSSFRNDNPNPKKRKAEEQIDAEDNGVEAAEEKSEITTKTERETSAHTCSKASEIQKPDYIHVRARRGQATDSHSLAERARREKISKKMKCLQDLVPGCNKITGKAGMLDEIINYVQSLQKQVEFLSMKLATVNPRLDFSIDNIPTKEIPAYISPSLPAQFEATGSTCFHYNPIQQGNSSLLIPEVFLDPPSITQLSGWESDWQSLFTAGFH